MRFVYLPRLNVGHGADEFVLLLPDTEAAGASVLAERLSRGLEALGLPHPTAPPAHRVTASVGVGTLAGGPTAGSASFQAGLLHQAARQALQAARRSPGRHTAPKAISAIEAPCFIVDDRPPNPPRRGLAQEKRFSTNPHPAGNPRTAA